MASSQPVLAQEEEDLLLQRIQEGDPDAVQELVLRNLRIAIDEAIRTRGLGLPQRELVRMGIRTLVEAAQNHDPLEDGPFSVCARSRVRQAMIRQVNIS